jgi:uncharacterized protein YukE
MLDPDQLRAGVSTLKQLADQYNSALDQWRNTLRQHDGCWGDDDMGKQFGQNFTSSEQQVDSGVDSGQQWFQSSTDLLNQAQNDFESTDSDNASQVGSVPLDSGTYSSGYGGTDSGDSSLDY